MLKLKIQYPNKLEEREIISRYAWETAPEPAISPILTREDIFEMRKCVDSIYIDEKIINYVLEIVFKTREPSPYIACGASPRASINLVKSAKCRAFLVGRDYTTPDDIKAMVYDIMRHRILLSYEAEAEGITAENLIEDILEKTNLP
jgi:MoxR-like ATPase